MIVTDARLDPRVLFQWKFAEAPVLNVGCESDPVGFGRIPFTVNMDIDDWNGTVAHFVQHDACTPWPFADKSFSTVVFGDSLDHMAHPERALVEAARVARRRIVATLPRGTPNESAGAHESHLADLAKLGLRAAAPGDLRRRHAHFESWTEARVRELLAAIHGALTLQTIEAGPVVYWGATVDVPESAAPGAAPVRWPRVSILLCTYRPGGLDLLFSGLAEQDYLGEWELVFVDELHFSAARRAAVDSAAWRWPTRGRIRHLPNTRTLYPRCSAGRAHNEAIVRAEGEIGIWLADHAAVRPSWIRDHALLHLQHGGGNLIVNGAYYYAWPPRLARDIDSGFTGAHPGYGVGVDALASAHFGRTTIFDREMSAAEAWRLPLQNLGRRDGVWNRTPEQDAASLSFVEGPIGSEYYFMKHDSVALAALRAVSGNDEVFDGTHMCHDVELSTRLAASGCVFQHSKRPAIRLIQIRHLMRSLDQVDYAEAQKVGAALLAETRARVARGDLHPRETHPELSP